MIVIAKYCIHYQYEYNKTHKSETSNFPHYSPRSHRADYYFPYFACVCGQISDILSDDGYDRSCICPV